MKIDLFDLNANLDAMIICDFGGNRWVSASHPWLKARCKRVKTVIVIDEYRPLH